MTSPDLHSPDWTDFHNLEMCYQPMQRGSYPGGRVVGTAVKQAPRKVCSTSTDLQIRRRIELKTPGLLRSILPTYITSFAPFALSVLHFGSDVSLSEQPSSKRQGKFAPRQLIYKYDGELN
jgi:hypothetical protein